MDVERKKRNTNYLFFAPKSTWKKIFKEFERAYPELSKKVIGYSPWGFFVIKVYLDDGMQLSYSSVDERAVILKKSDKPDE